MPEKQAHILLADDDTDDCLLFKEALKELRINAQLTTVPDGEMLMRSLHQLERLPDMLFLDLNMPRKNGMECLIEMKQSTQLKAIPVIIFSTSFERPISDLLYENGAHYCMKKPVTFSQFKELIHCAYSLTLYDREAGNPQPARSNFILTPESCSDEN